MTQLTIEDAVAIVPDGRWIVGVSGGADSVALLRALRTHRPEISLTVAHLNHKTRGAESDADERFVADLAVSLGIEVVTSRLSELVPPPARGLEAAFRRARLAMFLRLATERSAAGVLLAHHADDRAETVLLRLLRGGEPWAVGGLRVESRVGPLRIVRPLIGVRRTTIEAYLHGLDQPWREDASNQSSTFARNRARQFLRDRPEMVPALLKLAEAADAVRSWIREASPTLPEQFRTEQLADLPAPLARRAARQWLSRRGVPSPSASDAVRLIEMCSDRSTAASGHWPGQITIRRRASVVRSDNNTT